MVFYFTSNVVSPPVTLYMGRDKYENEELIRWGWPEDVWFHVKNYSSAHVYLRLEKNQTIDKIPEEILIDAAQLVKANSIQGNKLNNIQVIYTLWENLKKTPSMCPGEVSFFNEGAVKTIQVERKINEIVNRLNKTKREENPDLRVERENRDAMMKLEEKRQLQIHKLQQKELEKQKQIQKENMSYDRIHKKENMTTNKDDGNDSDDFM